MKEYYVYILSNQMNSVLYIGVSNDLIRRMYEHKNKLVNGFSKRYNLNKLLYFEKTRDIEAAILREKKLKNWHRQWKLNLIKENNPEFKDLSAEWFNGDSESSSE